MTAERKEVILENINWIPDDPKKGKTYQVRIRYRQIPHECTVMYKDEKILLVFETPQTVDAGQSAVLYDGETCIGGGVIQ